MAVGARSYTQRLHTFIGKDWQHSIEISTAGNFIHPGKIERTIPCVNVWGLRMSLGVFATAHVEPARKSALHSTLQLRIGENVSLLVIRALQCPLPGGFCTCGLQTRLSFSLVGGRDPRCCPDK